jgi:hypothetical protein
MAIPKVVVTLPSEAALDGLYCPACGKGLLAEDSQEICPHVLFCYESEAGEFTYVAPPVDALLWQTGSDRTAGQPRPVDRLCERIESPSALCLQIDSGGVTHVPVCFETYIGIDFWPYGR